MGGINRSTVHVAPYADANDTEIAKKNAQLIVTSDALAVIGHSSAETTTMDVGYFTQNIKFNWGVFVPPAPKDSTSYAIFQPDVAIGINKNIPPARQQAALRFLKWLMTQEGLKETLSKLPGFYPLISSPLKLSDNSHDAQFQELKVNHPTDLRWAYSELSVTNQLPSAASLMQKAQYNMIAYNFTPQHAADDLQAGLAQWYEPAQTCKK